MIFRDEFFKIRGATLLRLFLIFSFKKITEILKKSRLNSYYGPARQVLIIYYQINFLPEPHSEFLRNSSDVSRNIAVLIIFNISSFSINVKDKKSGSFETALCLIFSIGILRIIF
jgi:hypothetical protein